MDKPIVKPATGEQGDHLHAVGSQIRPIQYKTPIRPIPHKMADETKERLRAFWAAKRQVPRYRVEYRASGETLDFTLEELADFMGMNEKYINVLFSKHKGSFHRYDGEKNDVITITRRPAEAVRQPPRLV